ncbi:MAG TPA: hypothetical protein VF576_04370 [Rubricoccaceae bacterium]|jgi:hypothetical protein
MYLPAGAESDAPEEAGLFRLTFSLPDELNHRAQRDAQGEALPDTSWALARVHDRPHEGAPVRGTVRAVTAVGHGAVPGRRPAQGLPRLRS